ncbi:tRNA (cytosine(38)-C(5))-methyltransferase [Symbiodinium microadriaticum]|uniref:tRNA (cytosine(38)-C(5))-methyltransferase n=1 Tax=Symbiodinium microadriaticum TaxID=2951 RepID=A0A1Q9D2S4_SYMMI|nr:tRNA (cytosine(38)-C(5))-methyltransferase [Symbiodinium microadriaticum]
MGVDASRLLAACPCALRDRSDVSTGACSSTAPVLPERLRVCELFAGIGGWRLALEAALPEGVSARFYPFDSGPHCSEIYSLNFGEACCRRNIEQLTSKDLEDFDVWLMSPPCQPFSTTREAKQRDLGDKRCAALDHLCKLLPLLRHPPRWIALENVKGFHGSDACAKWRGALQQAGFRDREIILDLSSFGTPNHRTRYYLLAERETTNLHLAEPASAPRLAGAMPPGALARGPWARERRIALEAAHAQARQSPRHEVKEAIFADARRAFVRALRQLLPSGESGMSGMGDGVSSFCLVGTEAWKLLPLPKDDPEALLVVFDTDGSVGTLATQFLEELPEMDTSLVSWSSWPPTGELAPRSVRCVGEFLETPSPEELAEILLSAATLSRPFAPGLSYVHAKDLRTFCFTGHYGKVLHKSSGSLLLTSEEPLDRSRPETAAGSVRFFSPKEILNFLGFPRSYTLPPEMALRHRYKVVGNSIAVTVASELLRLLLLGQGAAHLAQMEQPPPTRTGRGN